MNPIIDLMKLWEALLKVIKNINQNVAIPLPEWPTPDQQDPGQPGTDPDKKKGVDFWEIIFYTLPILLILGVIGYFVRSFRR